MTNHCTFKQSQDLKEIGFEYNPALIVISDKTKVTDLSYDKIKEAVSLPTRSEVLQWAREKKGIDAWVRPYKDPEGIQYYGYETYQVHSYYNCYPTYPEAEDALIDKIIEIIKKQKG